MLLLQNRTTTSQPFLCRFPGRLDDDGSHDRQQQASGKRQGTKSREIVHPTLRARLWGFVGVDGGQALGQGLRGGRFEFDVSARPGERSLKKGEKTAAVRVQTGDRVCGGAAGE